MHELLLLLTALLFYGIGRYVNHEIELLSVVKKHFQKRHNSLPVGPIAFPTPKDLKYAGSEEEKINEIAKQKLKEVGLR